MRKNIQNVNIITCKLGPTLTNAINYKLEVAKEEQCNKEKIVKKQKKEAMTAKRYRNRGEISLSSGKKKN